MAQSLGCKHKRFCNFTNYSHVKWPEFQPWNLNPTTHVMYAFPRGSSNTAVFAAGVHSLLQLWWPARPPLSSSTPAKRQHKPINNKLKQQKYRYETMRQTQTHRVAGKQQPMHPMEEQCLCAEPGGFSVAVVFEIHFIDTAEGSRQLAEVAQRHTQRTRGEGSRTRTFTV